MNDDTEIAADAIDAEFIPTARPDVAAVLVGGEIVLGRVPDGTPHLHTCALNESGSIVWQCFDGSGSIAEIAADIAEVFGADLDAVTNDVATLARDVGALGFLVGVRESVLTLDDEPIGLAVGEPLPDFDAVDEHGRTVSSASLRGHRTLLVNWSPTCNFCAAIADDLAALTAELSLAGVELVKVAMRDRDRDRDETELDPLGFEALGTPVAYLIDEAGTVAEPLALGSTEVVTLARRASRR